MRIPLEADVLVVGAGPAGAAAAGVAASAGLRVLLADSAAPERSHELMVSAVAAQRMAAFGAVPDRLRTADSVELCFPATTRRVAGAGAAIVEASALRAALSEAARAAGAELVAARATGLSQVGDACTALLDGTLTRVRHIVLASGSANVTRPVHADPSPAVGIACAQRFTDIDVAGQIVLAPLTPPAESSAPPTMLTVLPGADGTATLWLACLGTTDAGEAGGLLADALARLACHDRRFEGARPVGEATSGLLSSSYSPTLVEDSPGMLIGDAAGLVNPFTGEGLGAALLSGILAADAIAEHRDDPAAARRQYAQRLAAEYVGYFETARHAARRYHLLWRTLEAAAASDHTFFAKARRAVLLPEELPGMAGDRVPVADADRVVTGPFLLACDEIAVAALRTQWPFLARLLLSGTGPSRHRIRPGLLMLGGLLAEDRPPDISLATPAAAVELATFGALAFLGAEQDPRRPRSVDWAAATLVMAGDFLMSRASQLIAESTPQASWAFADWLAELSTLRAARLNDPPGPATDMHACLMEFPARLGALLGGCSPDTVETLRTVGGLLGEAFTYSEDVLALTGRRTRLDMTLQASLSCRASAIPDLTSTPPAHTGRRLDDPAFRAAAQSASELACTEAIERAHAAIATVPGSMARQILAAYATAIAASPRNP